MVTVHGIQGYSSGIQAASKRYSFFSQFWTLFSSYADFFALNGTLTGGQSYKTRII
jgi:hypothetical protein